MHRQLGQTTEQLLSVLDNLAHGPTTTFYVWPVGSSIDYPFDLLMHLLDYRFERPVEASRIGGVVDLETGARIRFVSLRGRPYTLRGHRNHNVVFDHACDHASRYAWDTELQTIVATLGPHYRPVTAWTP